MQSYVHTVEKKLTVQPAVGSKKKVQFIKNHADFGIVFKHMHR